MFWRIVVAGSLSCAVLWATGIARADSASNVLARARTASGGDVWDHDGAIRFTGTDHVKGFDANWQETVDLVSGRFHDSTNFGIFATNLVWDGRTLWQQGRSGGVHPINSAFALRNNVTNGWIAARGYLKPDALGARLQMGIEKSEGGRSYAIVKATPVRGETIELWFDKRTNRLARTVQFLPTSVRTVRYDDYKAVRGRLLPFRVTIDDGDDANADHILVTQTAHPTDTEADFRRPKSPTDFAIAGGSTAVPVEYDGFITVQAKINGKGPYPFILDTGGRALLTPEVASELGLRLVGSGIVSGAGEHTVGVHFAKVNRTQIGELTVRGLTFGVLPMAYDTVERGARVPFAGILGLELFERFDIRLDYRRRLLTIFPPEDAPHQGAAIPIVFEDDMPIVSARIDDIRGDVALDTGFPESLAVQGIWAERNGLKGRLRKLRLQASGGQGGAITLWASRARMKFAGVNVPNIVAYYAENKSGSLSSRTTAGIVGNAVLAGFTLDFDYAHNRIWFSAERKNEQQPYDRSGLSVSKADRNAFTIGFVASGSPAAEAGLLAGDAITAVDGRHSSELSGWDFGHLMRRPPRHQHDVDSSARR